MVANLEKHKFPKIVVWYGRIIICLGVLLFAFGIVAAIGHSLKGGVLIGLYSLYKIGGTALGVCGFGAAVSRGDRGHLFGLLILILFGSLLIGLFSMVGRETNIGYYIWAVGGCISLSLILVLYIDWDEFPDS